MFEVMDTNRCVPKMSRVAHRILGREDLAADAVQEALITFHFLEEAPVDLERWLLRTVTHRSLAARRAEVRRARNEHTAGCVLADHTPNPDPECELCRKEMARAIRRALTRLPDEQKTAFLLRELQGLDYEKIALAQGVPIGTVRSRLNRARKALQRGITLTRSSAMSATVRMDYRPVTTG